MDGYGFARGPYSDHLVLFVEYKRGKGEKGGHNRGRRLRLGRPCAKQTSSKGASMARVDFLTTLNGYTL